MGIQGEYRERCRRDTDVAAHLGILYAWGLRSPVMVELGVRAGNSTCALLAAAARSGGHLWSIDLEPPDTPRWWRDLDCWTLITGHDRDVTHLVPDVIDLLFIDTSHLAADTTAELTLYGTRVREGGVILLHDAELPGVHGPVAEWYGRDWTYHMRDHGLAVIER